MQGQKQPELSVLLAGITVFGGLDDQQLALLGDQFRLIECPAGEELISEGQVYGKLSVIVDGKVDIFLPKSEQRFSEIRLASMGRGELFGEYSFVDMRPASASVRTVSDCRLLQIDYADLYKILDADNAIARRFYENLLLVLIDRLRADDRELDMFTIA